MAREDKSTETIDYLVAELQRTDGTLNRAEVVVLLQYLESLGCGKFTTARNGKPSRMSWPFDHRTVGRIALEEGDEFMSTISYSALVTDEEGMSHQRARPVRSAATAWCLWDDILNEGE